MEQPVNTEQINALQAELIQYLTDCFPPVWSKLCFYAEVTPASVRIWLMQADLESDTVCTQDYFQRYCAGHFVPGRDEVKRKLNQLAASLHFYCTEACGKEKTWRSMFLTITSDGSSHSEFAWAPLAEQDDPFLIKRAAFEYFFGGS